MYSIKNTGLSKITINFMKIDHLCVSLLKALQTWYEYDFYIKNGEKKWRYVKIYIHRYACVHVDVYM